MAVDTLVIDKPPTLDLTKPFLQYFWRDKPQSVVEVVYGEDRFPVTINQHILPQTE